MTATPAPYPKTTDKSVIEGLKSWSNIASETLGTEALFATDNFFAVAPLLLKDADPVFVDGKFTEFGKF